MSKKRDDVWQDPTAVAWVRHVIDDMVPKMSSSSAVVSIAPSDGEGDVKFWTELGASIMLGKPLVVVAFGDDPVPDKLRLVADEVVRLQAGADPAGAKELQEALNRVAGDDEI